MRNIIRAMEYYYRRLKNKIELWKYDNSTIEEYFRKQGAQVGEGCALDIRSLGTERYLIKIGNHVGITKGVQFLTHDAGVDIFRKEVASLQRFGIIEIRDNSFIGMESIIMPNVTIGPNALVAARSVVTKNVPPNIIVGGNPAKPIRDLEDYRKKDLETWSIQKPPGYMKEIHDAK
jgi:acetyltransferase-like isoleucine patch superfamily enzyme